MFKAHLCNYRLKYHNLKKERSNNLLSRKEIENLWIPFVVFSNTENNEFTDGNDDTEVTITKEGNFTAADLDVLEEVNIFEGRENSITFQQVYSKTFKCEYELQERYWSSSLLKRCFVITMERLDILE